MNKELLQAFQKVRDTMPSVNKNAKGYNYKYADLPHLWESIEKVITDAGFTVVNYADAGAVVTKVIHEAGELESKLPIAGITDPQDLGAAITYFRRYNLLMIFNVMIEDNDAAKPQKAPEKAVDKLLEEFRANIQYCTTLEELKEAWTKTPDRYKPALLAEKDSTKAKLSK